MAFLCRRRLLQAVPSPSLGLSDIASLRRMVLLRYLLHQQPPKHLTLAQFCDVARRAGMESHDEQKAALLKLHAARHVVYVEQHDIIHTDPEDVVRRCCDALGVSNSNVEQHSPVAANTEAAPLVLSETSLWRKRFWGAVAAGGGAQIVLLSFLTFVKYDWDVMEPACYFLSTAWSLLFYLYFIVFRKEHTLRSVDETVLPSVLERKFSSAQQLTRVSSAVDGGPHKP